MPAVESMDFTEIEKKAADIPGISGLELSQKTFPALNRTCVLEVLLRLHGKIILTLFLGWYKFAVGKSYLE